MVIDKGEWAEGKRGGGDESLVGVRGGYQPETSDAGKPPSGGPGGKEPPPSGG